MALDLLPNFVTELLDLFSPNFIYAFILTRSSFGLLHIIFRKIVPELWPFIYAKISIPLYILKRNCQIFTKFYICIHNDKIWLGILTHHSSEICTRVMALYLCQNIISTQYLENKLVEFQQILYMHSSWQDRASDCYTPFFTNCTRVMALGLP